MSVFEFTKAFDSLWNLRSDSVENQTIIPCMQYIDITRDKTKKKELIIKNESLVALNFNKANQYSVVSIRSEDAEKYENGCTITVKVTEEDEQTIVEISNNDYSSPTLEVSLPEGIFEAITITGRNIFYDVQMLKQRLKCLTIDVGFNCEVNHVDATECNILNGNSVKLNIEANGDIKYSLQTRNQYPSYYIAAKNITSVSFKNYVYCICQKTDKEYRGGNNIITIDVTPHEFNDKDITGDIEFDFKA